MANFFIPAPNYTQTPNVFFDEMAKTLKEGELRIVLVIMRQTFGWRKHWDQISLSKLCEKTGMNRSSVCRSLLSLIEKKIVEKRIFGVLGQERCYYRLCVSFEEKEEKYTEESMCDEERKMLQSFRESDSSSPQYHKDTPPVSQRHPPQYHKDTPPSITKIPTKETIKETVKETTTTKESDGLDSSKKEQKKDSSSFSFNRILKELEELPLDKSQKKTILMAFDDETITRAVKCLAQCTKQPDDVGKYIYAACKGGWSPIKSKEEIYQENFKTAIKYDGARLNEKYDSARIIVCKNYLEISMPGYSIQPVVLEMKEKDFIERLNVQLKKYGFIT